LWYTKSLIPKKNSCLLVTENQSDVVKIYPITHLYAKRGALIVTWKSCFN